MLSARTQETEFSAAASAYSAEVEESKAGETFEPAQVEPSRTEEPAAIIEAQEYMLGKLEEQIEAQRQYQEPLLR